MSNGNNNTNAETNRRFQIGHQTCEKVSGNLDSPRRK
jgi:hypothetical protein